VRGGRAKARQGLCRHTLEGRSPREHPASVALNARLPARDSRKGKSPEAAACRAGPPRQRLEERQAKRHVGPPRWKHRRYLAGGESSEGRIPGALPARNKAGADPEGVSRREGNQTLRADRSGQAKPAASGSPVPHVLKGSEVHERSRPGFGWPARIAGLTLWRKAKLDERRRPET